MRSDQIYNEILSLSDEEILSQLPTEDKNCCSKCKSINLRQRKKDEKFYCSTCKGIVEIETIPYYYKNKTVHPHVAIERHRIFWDKIYKIELGKELVQKHINNLK